jgi:hypothetical protein
MTSSGHTREGSGLNLELAEYDLELPPSFQDEVESYGAADLEHAYTARIANRPYARSLKELYRLKNRKLPPELATLKGQPYTVTHALGVVASQKPKRVQRISFEAQILGGRAFTVDLFPNSSFISQLSGELDAGFEAGLSAEGHAKAATPNLINATPIALGAGAEVRLATDSSLIGNIRLRMGIKTPFIQAVGQASSSATWQLDRHDTALVGDQALIQTVIVDDDVSLLTYQISAYVVVDRWLRSPVRLGTKSITTDVELPVKS